MPNYIQQIERLEQLRQSLVNLDSAGSNNFADARVAVIEALQNLGVDNLNDLVNPKTAETKALGQPLARTNIVLPASISKREKINAEVMDLLDRINAEDLTRDDLTPEEIETLAQFTGFGGGVENKRTLQTGSQYEYYTPIELAAGMWDFAEELGFKGGKVLDPSAGTGIFAATSPQSAVIENIELDSTSGGVGKVLNDGERSHTIVSSFEKQAKNMPDDSIDMVITNIPFGDHGARGKNYVDDNAYRNETLDGYFILRSLNKLKSGGLAMFITPRSVVSGKAADKERVRIQASLQADFLGAYRLPNAVFASTGANVVTDVIVFRKHSKDAREKINDLYQAGDMETLTASNVLWGEFISGSYFKDPYRKQNYILGDEEEYTNKYNQKDIRIIPRGGQTTKDLAKMLRKFGDSRINWAMIEASEPNYIEYKNGDTLFQNGKQLKYDNGVWREVEREVTDTDLEMRNTLTKVGNAYDIVVNDVTWDQVTDIKNYCDTTGQRDLIPYTVQDYIVDIMQNIRPEAQSEAWECITMAKAIDALILEHGYTGYNYKENHKKLTSRMKGVYAQGKNAKLTGSAGVALKTIALHYNKGKYSSAWLGEINNEVALDDNADSYQNKLARLQYENKSLYVTTEQLKSIHPDIKPLEDDGWFVSHDGKQVIKAEDYLVGSLADRLKDIDEEIAKATDDKVRNKLIRQKDIARSSVQRIDFKKLQYDLRSPIIDAETKVRFLKQFVSPHALVAYDSNGISRPDINAPTNLVSSTDEDKLVNRMGDWLSKGTVTLQNVKLKNYNEREALEWLSNTIKTANINFNNWVKSDKNLLEQLDRKGNADENLYFTQNADDSPIDIAGLNPKLNLHGYQNEFVRKQGRFFGGINGMGVGLGKTFSALASVQHVHNIGAKKKTLFVVPNSVLSNWRKEAQFAYQSMDDCIFVGLREKGDKFRVHSNKYDEDLIKAIDGKYRKVFLTYEAFRRIRLKEETIASYAQYLKDNDSAYAFKELKKDADKAEGFVAELLKTIKIESSAPFLEDMNVDSIVIDEAHAFKNSITAPKTNAQVKYLSLPKTSARGEDAQAKLFYVRGETKNNDGVQLLSATPITNSPLEVYSMLSLAAGRKAVNSMAAGAHGADEFLQMMCEIEEEVVPTIDGGERAQNVFTGLRNVQILRKAISATATIKDAKDVGMSVVIPDREEKAVKVELDMLSSLTLQQYQNAYKTAKELLKDSPMFDPDDPENPSNPNSSYQVVKRIFNEPDKLMAHPFNLINKMDILIADDDFGEQATFYDFDEGQKAIAEKVIADFNKKPTIDERERLSVYTDPSDAAGIYSKDDGKKELVGYKVKVKAKTVLNNGRERIVIDTLDSKIQTRFEKLADKNNLKLNVTVSAKVAAMLDNFKNEMANPRGTRSDGTVSKVVKQIIFCDHLFLHNKLKRLLAERAGVKADKIVIITGQTNNEPDQMIDIQDGFNAMDDENRYQVIIANQKAEVGINLQKGTQAIHHLTTGWTPDSLEQRNGRGARQGNMTDKVTIYHYDADGTFDEFKRTMINKKDEWITDLLSSDGKDTVAITGGISREEQEALIEFGSDKDAIAKYQAEKEAKEAEARITAIKKRQDISLQTTLNQKERLEGLSPKTAYYNDVINAIEIIRANKDNFKKSQDKSVKKPTRDNAAKKYEQSKQIAISTLNEILSSVSYVLYTYPRREVTDDLISKHDVTAEEIYAYIEDNTRDFGPAKKSADPNDNDSWPSKFMSAINYLKSEKGIIDDVIVKEDSSYTQDYEAAKQAAQSLMEQSAQAVDDITEEYGSSAYPSGAGQKIVNGEATIHKGQYLELGSIVIHRGAVKVVNKPDFRLSYLTPYADITYSPLLKDTEIEVINTNDKRYVDYVKELAGIEDKFYEANKLDVALYSALIPMVADFRDDSILIRRPIRENLGNERHPRLTNFVMPLVLPVSMLTTGTAFARKLSDDYLAAGINIYPKDNQFTINKDSNIDVHGIITLYSSDGEREVGRAIADYVRGNNIVLTEDDALLLQTSGIAKELLRVDEQTVEKIKEDMENSFDLNSGKEYELEDFEVIADELFDKHLNKDGLIADDVFNNLMLDKDGLLYNATTVGYVANQKASDRMMTSYLGAKIEANRLKREAEEAERAAREAAGEELEPDLEDDYGEFKPTDRVRVTGNTLHWKDQIKAYATKYGSTIKKGSNYGWYKRGGYWLIHYSAYEKLAEDYPAVDRELMIVKD